MTDSLSQPSLSGVSLEERVRSVRISTPTKPVEMLYGSKPIYPGTPTSLNRMIYNSSSLKAAHAAFVRDYEQSRSPKKVSFDSNPYGYGYDEPEVEERPVKRRRFERRNSKTPAMLMAMSAALDLDFLAKHDNEDQSKEDDEDNWDGGLEIAEELVKQLQQRRKSFR